MLQFFALPFYESVLQYLNPEFPKLHYSDRVFSTVYALILEQLLMPKILYFFVCAAFHKQPLSRSFLSFLRLDITDYEIFTNPIQNFT